MDIVYLVSLSFTGFAIGFVGGMVGLVLGAVRFPVIMSVEPTVSIASGTNLSISTLGAITAAIRHYRQRNIFIHAFLILGITGAAGAFIGSFLTSYIPVPLLMLAIGVIVSYESFALLRESHLKNSNSTVRKTASGRVRIHRRNRLILLESIIGFGIGFIGGVVGLVLGSIRMPAMITVLNIEPKIAVGTNLAASSIMGISGLTGHLINNNIDYSVLITMGSGAMIGGYIGARYTTRFSDKSLKRIIGLVLTVVAVIMFVRVFTYYDL